MQLRLLPVLLIPLLLNSCALFQRHTPDSISGGKISELEPQDPNLEHIIIFGTNDIHGTIQPVMHRSKEPEGKPYVQYTRGGLAMMAGHVKLLRERYGNRLLLLDAGDQFQGSIESNLEEGAPMVQYFNAVGLAASAISLTAEATTPLKQMGYSQIAGFFADLAGFQRIAAGLMGTLENAAIYRPLMWEANKRFRPNIPDDRQLTLMYQKRSLSREELADYQERLGLPDLYIDRLPGFIFNDPNPGLLIRAFQVAEPGKVTFSPDDLAIMRRARIDPEDPDAYFKLKFAKSGRDDTDVQAFVPVVKMGILRREQTIRYSQVERLYRDGFIDETRARAETEEARKPAGVVDYRMAALGMVREYEVLSDTRAVVLMSMARGLITRDEARQRLGELGMPGDRVELEVLKATLGMISGVRLTISRPEEVLEEVEGP